jgi:hypothetical protein
MTAEELLAEVQALGVAVHADGDVLRFRPGSAIPPTLVEELRAHKPELLELVCLQGWPPESLDWVRRFRQPQARLFPFIGRAVVTPKGGGRLLQVFADMAAVVLDQEPDRAVFFLPSDIRPPGLAHLPGEPFETAS